MNISKKRREIEEKEQEFVVRFFVITIFMITLLFIVEDIGFFDTYYDLSVPNELNQKLEKKNVKYVEQDTFYTSILGGEQRYLQFMVNEMKTLKGIHDFNCYPCYKLIYKEGKWSYTMLNRVFSPDKVKVDAYMITQLNKAVNDFDKMQIAYKEKIRIENSFK